VGSLTTADTVVAERFDAIGLYAAGHVFFKRGLNLMAQSFDEETLQLQGDPVPLGVQVRPYMLPGFSVSASGRLVFVPPPTAQTQLTWRYRSGRLGETVGDPGTLGNLDLSPDGRQLAFSKQTPRPDAEAQTDIWLVDLATGRERRLTDDPAGDNDPAWSPDGKYIVFNSSRLGPRPGNLFMRASDGSGVDVPLVTSETDSFTVAAWSRADVLIFNAFNKNNPSDLWTMSMSGPRTRKVFLSSKHSELNGTFSPDGRWVAYQSNASGRDEVLVRPFPNKDPARTISRDGGMYPRWRGDGKELFFVSTEGTMMAIGFDPTSGLPKGVPQALFSTQIWMGDNRPYAVDKNGERFLVPIGPEPRVIAVMDWRALVNSTEAR
jgi:dipeptidyl aminopeptidase/acylaminoacyl peptidase